MTADTPMRASSRVIGTSAGHARQGARPVYSHLLHQRGGITVEVLTYGATLREVWVPDRHGVPENVVIGHSRLGDYETPRGPRLGSTLGRFARNITHGRFDLDGRMYQLDRNDGEHHIHGGAHGFDRLVWESEVKVGMDVAAVHLWLDSHDGDQGYPGHLRAETTYRLSADRTLTFEHAATTSASTIVGMTNHAYWNLRGGGRVDEQWLQLNSDQVLAFDQGILPAAGPGRDVRAGPLDFTRPKRLGANAVDRFFILRDDAYAAVLHDPHSGRRMTVQTDAPGLAVYTADRYTHSRSGLTLQTSCFPDAPNRPDFPSVRLDPGDVYYTRTVHRFDDF